MCACAAIVASCTSFELVPGRSVVVPSDEVILFNDLCSRAGPPTFEGTWTPTPADIRQLEAHLPQVRKLRAKLCCLKGAQVRDVNDFYRQYAGIVIDGRRFIYVNAYPVETMTSLTPHPEVDWCDGGDDFWGVLYDVEARRFKDLAVNGIG